MTVIVDDYAVSYEQTGAGPNLVLLHGWGDNKETFDDLSEALSVDHTVTALDLPGFGKTDAPKEVFDLQKYAAFVASCLQKIGVDDVECFIGHSNGGAIAIRGLSEGTLKAKKLVLLASSGVRSTYNKRRKALRASAKVAKMVTTILPKSLQIKIKKKAYKTIGSDLFVAEHLQDTFKKVVSEDLVGQAANITIPTLLVYGSEDTATPPSYGERFSAQIKDSTLIVVDGAEHFLHHTHASKITKLLTEFLR
jgi:pimeloyl-ACP methyl ester carboxylesterase